MSTVTYTKCDGKDCGRVVPDNREYTLITEWTSIRFGGKNYDLCPECSKKALACVIEDWRANDAD